MNRRREITTATPEETFELGESLGSELKGGEIVLLDGGLGAGKTLLTKGILTALDFDVDEVTSPSFTLVNLYKVPRFDVYHIDLWRSDPSENPAFAVGLDEILMDETAVVIIEWADHLGNVALPGRVIQVQLFGDGDDPRKIVVTHPELIPSTSV